MLLIYAKPGEVGRGGGAVCAAVGTVRDYNVCARVLCCRVSVMGTQGNKGIITVVKIMIFITLPAHYRMQDYLIVYIVALIKKNVLCVCCMWWVLCDFFFFLVKSLQLPEL